MSCIPVTTEQFIERAIILHGEAYDYSDTLVKGMNQKVAIECKIHGTFVQRAADHLNGKGCFECSKGKRGQYSTKYFESLPEEGEEPGILYLAIIKQDWCKVGITKQKSSSNRFKSNDVQIVRKRITTLKEAYESEQEMLIKYKRHRFKAHPLRIEQFAGWTECFPVVLLTDLIQEFD